jgi:hypothetical protein
MSNTQPSQKTDIPNTNTTGSSSDLADQFFVETPSGNNNDTSLSSNVPEVSANPKTKLGTSTLRTLLTSLLQLQNTGDPLITENIAIYMGAYDQKDGTQADAPYLLEILLKKITINAPNIHDFIIPLAQIGRKHWTLLHITRKTNTDNILNFTLYDPKGPLSSFFPTEHIKKAIEIAFSKMKINFRVKYLGNQGVFNNHDCGRWVALYACELIKTSKIDKPYQLSLDFESDSKGIFKVKRKHAPIGWLINAFRNPFVRLGILILAAVTIALIIWLTGGSAILPFFAVVGAKLQFGLLVAVPAQILGAVAMFTGTATVLFCDLFPKLLYKAIINPVDARNYEKAKTQNTVNNPTQNSTSFIQQQVSPQTTSSSSLLTPILQPPSSTTQQPSPPTQQQPPPKQQPLPTNTATI